MKILGDALLAKDENGKLKSRIGTLFLRTPGLVTAGGMHALQRQAWLDELNRARAAEGRPALSPAECDEELASSVDLIFTDNAVLIRPDPARMDLAFRADEELQTFVSKRQIRFLNTHAAKVRDALRARGENWRMARAILAPEEMDALLASAQCAIAGAKIYYYNRHTGTRYLTPGSYADASALPFDAFRAQLEEIVHGLKTRNRLGQPEIDLFPTELPPAVKERFRALDLGLSEEAIRAEVAEIVRAWRMAVPAELREESAANFEWRNTMCAALTREPIETTAGDQDLIQGISPEFYRQIEWLPGACVLNGELVFDALFDEAERTGDPELAELCDARVKAIVFNLLRLFGTVEYVNVGRIARSLARRPVQGSRRGNVYIVQYKELDREQPQLMIIRFQKWGIAEHLDEGKDLLRAIVEANEYSDYILDRRLACRQLGMRLPSHVGFGQFTEKYRGHNQYSGTTVRAYYYVRQYVPGTASDKVPPERFRNPAFALKFAELMGEAAALDAVVGRAATTTGEYVFDRGLEIVQTGAGNLPAQVMVVDHAGSFVDYQRPLEEIAKSYADVVRRRAKFMADAAPFAKTYVEAFRKSLEAVQGRYRANPHAFDNLFAHRPYDVAGSGAYRWSCALKRLAACDPARVAASLEEAISC